MTHRHLCSTCHTGITPCEHAPPCPWGAFFTDHCARCAPALADAPPPPPKPKRTRAPAKPKPPEIAPDTPVATVATEHPEEFLVDRTTGRLRQAGASADDTPWVAEFRRSAEQSLYVFAKAIMGHSFLTNRFHLPMCNFLQKRPPQRKLVVAFAGSGKSTIVSRSQPIHMFVQPKDANLYFPGKPGNETRIILCCENETRASDHLRVVASALESNDKLRALWPHVVWENPRQQSKKWNDTELIIRRDQSRELPDPSLRGLGVGAALAAVHPDAKLGDDLISLKAAQSSLVMEESRTWWLASRARINEDHCLEVTIANRWAIEDIYATTIIPDPTVETLIQPIQNARGEPAWPEWFPREKIAALKAESGNFFPLLYMLEPHDPSLTDFQPDQLRSYRIDGERILFDQDIRDALLAERADVPPPVEDVDQRGQVLDGDAYDALRERGLYLRRARTA